MLPMRQKGAWWKGLTDDGVEVAISDTYFKGRFTKQMQNRSDHPLLTSRTEAYYGVAPACLSPQWWVECYQQHPHYALTPWDPQTWVRRKNYEKLMLGSVTTNGSCSNEVGSEGTLIFRKLSAKRVQQLLDFEAMLVGMRGEVESYFQNEFGATVEWR